jgi:hypothetical protein
MMPTPLVAGSIGGGAGEKKEKVFFSEEKKQKTFANEGVGAT